MPACGACLGGCIRLRYSFAAKICSVKRFLIFDILESARRTNACVTVVIASYPPGSRNRRPSAACWTRVPGEMCTMCGASYQIITSKGSSWILTQIVLPIGIKPPYPQVLATVATWSTITKLKLLHPFLGCETICGRVLDDLNEALP